MGPGTLRGASAEAMADLSQRLGKPATLDEAATIGDELFAVTNLLRADPALRRVATDASLRRRPETQNSSSPRVAASASVAGFPICPRRSAIASAEAPRSDSAAITATVRSATQARADGAVLTRRTSRRVSSVSTTQSTA